VSKNDAERVDNKDDLIKAAGKAAVWDFLGKISIQLSTFVLSIFLARLLEPADFGLLALAMVGIGLSSLLYEAGFPNIIIQSKSISQEQLSTVFFLNLALGGLCSGLIFFLAPAIAVLFNQPELSLLVQVLSLLPLLESSKVVHVAMAQRGLKLHIIALVRFSVSAISLLVALVLAFRGFGVWSLVVKTYLGSGLAVIVYWFVSPWRPTRQYSFASVRNDLRYGATMLGSSAITRIFNQLDTILIGKFFSAELLGLFNRAKSLMNLLVKYISSSISAVYYPLVSRLQDDAQRLAKMTQLNLTLISMVLFPVSVLLWLTAPELISLLYGEKWLPAVKFLRLILFAVHMSPFASILASILAGRGKAQAHLRLEMIKKSLYLVLSVGGYFFADITGFLVGTVIAHNLGVSLNVRYAATELEVKSRFLVAGVFWNLFGIVVALACSFALVAVASGLPYHKLIQSLLFVCVYGILVILFHKDLIVTLFEKVRPLQRLRALRRS